MGIEVESTLMNKKLKLDELKLLPVVLILVGVMLRLLPHPANFTPIAALALFGAVYLPKRFGFILPIAALLISDFFIGFYGFTQWFVYGSFLLTGLIGLFIRSHKSVFTIVGGSIISSVLFFLITNFAVWAEPRSFYPPGIDGLFLSYTAGIPFFRNSLVGDLFFTGVFFGGYELVKLVLFKFMDQKSMRKLI